MAAPFLFAHAVVAVAKTRRFRTPCIFFFHFNVSQSYVSQAVLVHSMASGRIEHRHHTRINASLLADALETHEQADAHPTKAQSVHSVRSVSVLVLSLKHTGPAMFGEDADVHDRINTGSDALLFDNDDSVAVAQVC